jgi:hypothetical protein
MVHVYDLQGGQWVTGFQAAAGMFLLNLHFRRRFNGVFGCEPGKRRLAWVAPQAVDFQRLAAGSTCLGECPQASVTKDALVCLYFCIISILILYRLDLRYCKRVLVPSIPSICCNIIRTQKIWYAR